MKSGDYEHVRLILRGRAAGGVTQADVQRRARELSLLRTGSENYTAEDIEDAEHELMIGRDPATMTDDADASFGASRDPGDPLTARGGMYDPLDPPEENAAPERLAVQGVEEAQHDQMVTARQRANPGRSDKPAHGPGARTSRRRKRSEH